MNVDPDPGADAGLDGKHLILRPPAEPFRKEGKRRGGREEEEFPKHQAPNPKQRWQTLSLL